MGGEAWLPVRVVVVAGGEFVEEPAAAYASQLGGDTDDEPMESLRA